MAVDEIDLRGEPADVARAIDTACRDTGFFTVVGHGVDSALCRRLDTLAREFFARPDDEKAEVAMERGGISWRGWFPLGAELTAGVPDQKEGIYFGAEDATTGPLRGPNLFPRRPAGLRATVLEYLGALTRLGHQLTRAIGVPAELVGNPTILFRIFRYPPAPDDWGVRAHTDYGLFTILLQDETGGLEVETPHGWAEVPPNPDAFVCNIGDMLERITAGRYRSTAHRVRNTGTRDRLSFPFFFDPSWDARIPGLDGTYGDYLTAKVSKVFPDLARFLH